MDIRSLTKKPFLSGPSSNVHRCSPRRSIHTGGIVYYANYLKFFERARTEWLRAAGYGQQRLLDEFGLQFVVAHIECSYQQPARLDDLIEIDLRVAKTGRVYIVFEQAARRGTDLLATARVKAACIDARRFAPAAMPADMTAAFRTLPGFSPTP